MTGLNLGSLTQLGQTSGVKPSQVKLREFGLNLGSLTQLNFGSLTQLGSLTQMGQTWEFFLVGLSLGSVTQLGLT